MVHQVRQCRVAYDRQQAAVCKRHCVCSQTIASRRKPQVEAIVYSILHHTTLYYSSEPQVEAFVARRETMRERRDGRSEARDQAGGPPLHQPTLQYATLYNTVQHCTTLY